MRPATAARSALSTMGLIGALTVPPNAGADVTPGVPTACRTHIYRITAFISTRHLSCARGKTVARTFERARANGAVKDPPYFVWSRPFKLHAPIGTYHCRYKVFGLAAANIRPAVGARRRSSPGGLSTTSRTRAQRVIQRPATAATTT